jgi:cbb3-type cytochrome oxidase subunit 1
VTAETASNHPDQASSPPRDSGVTRIHVMVASIFLIFGSLIGAVAALQLVLPDLLAGNAFSTYGRLAPAARILLTDGWLTIGLLGCSYIALSRVTGSAVVRSAVPLASLLVIAVGALGAAVGVALGMHSGITGIAEPLWARAILAIGYLLAAVAVVGIARTARDSLGATGWYLTAAPIWLALSGLVAVIPMSDGIAGSIQMAFSSAGTTGLFFVTASVGLLYHAFTWLTATDPTAPRPLSTLGFWSLTVVWANLAAVRFIFSPAPDWYETLAVAFAIASLIPALTIATDLGLMITGKVSAITDRATLRYAVIASLALVLATVVLLLTAWRATSGVVQFAPWVNGLDALILLGGGSFAIFATVSILRGGRTGGPSVHYVLSTLGILAITAGLLVGGVVVGFSWAAGPAGQGYVNAEDAWKVTADSSALFLWIAAIGAAIFAIGQIAFVIPRHGEPAGAAAFDTADYDLEFEGPPRYASWGRLITGVVGVWAFAALMTWILPAADGADREATILADTSRTYVAGSVEAIGRDLYISEGCIECHTQQVRPIGSDVGLGPVSIAGDYANENPALLGASRFGPDLMHYAGRVEFFDKVIVRAHLANPRSVVPWSTMPSYAYLSSDDLSALVSYIETLR